MSEAYLSPLREVLRLCELLASRCVTDAAAGQLKTREHDATADTPLAGSIAGCEVRH
jgi:hypothetical protein